MIAEVAADLGRPLMPWQSDFADVLGEYDPDTLIPFYSTGFYTVPRRSGKTLLLLSWGLRRMLAQRNQRVPWSAQSRSDARELWIDELYPLLRASRLRKTIAKLGEGNGGEHIKLKNGSVMRLVAPGEKSGHGKGIHGSAEDEIFADDTAWRNNAFGPGMATVPDSQTLKTSAAGTARSTVFNEYRRQGRQAVLDGKDQGICYLEYSADEDWDHMDPDTYWRHMPALGYTITLNKIRSLIEDMLLDPKEGLEGVRRAYGNIPAGMGASSEISAEVWARVNRMDSRPDPAGAVIAVAVSQDRSTASIAVCDSEGRVELVRNAAGVGWLVEKANSMAKEHRAVVVLDGGGPAGALADSIPKCEPMGSKAVYRACGAFYDAVLEATGVTVRTHPLLNASVEGMVKKIIGDKFVWSRKDSTEDITPLEAATLAWWSATHPGEGGKAGFAFVSGG
jgi:hypothetical protein